MPRCGKCHQALPWIADADDATFGEVAEAAKIPVVVDLRAPWCGPCRMVSPALEQLVKVNAGTSPQISQRFGVQAIPALLVLRRGQVAVRQTGAVPPPAPPAPPAALRTWAGNACRRRLSIAAGRQHPASAPGAGAARACPLGRMALGAGRAPEFVLPAEYALVPSRGQNPAQQAQNAPFRVAHLACDGLAAGLSG